MRNFFHRKSSRQIAKDRLKILLISDRVSCSPEMLELIKTDIARVISKYMKIDAENMEIQINTKGNKTERSAKPSLYASIPIVDMQNGAKETILH
ncbi:MAG: cell division topological specificity factor MinE [Firmicutes bacterium]|nr:cell division topological specificity factor MinE [Bacillota bacterium]